MKKKVALAEELRIAISSIADEFIAPKASSKRLGTATRSAYDRLNWHMRRLPKHRERMVQDLPECDVDAAFVVCLRLASEHAKATPGAGRQGTAMQLRMAVLALGRALPSAAEALTPLRQLAQALDGLDDGQQQELLRPASRGKGLTESQREFRRCAAFALAHELLVAPDVRAAKHVREELAATLKPSAMRLGFKSLSDEVLRKWHEKVLHDRSIKGSKNGNLHEPDLLPALLVFRGQSTSEAHETHAARYVSACKAIAEAARPRMPARTGK